MSMLRTNANAPLHLRVAERIKGLIARHFAPGEVLPPYLELAGRFRVGLVTVKRAMDVLAAKGIVTPIRRRGTVVNRRIRPGEIRLSQVGLVARCTLEGLFDARRLCEIVSALCLRVDALDSDLRVFCRRRAAGCVPPAEVAAAGADGAILVGVRDPDSIREFARQDIPLVVLDHCLADLALDYVVCDDRSAVAAVVDHLAALGHRRIAYVEVLGPAASGPGPAPPAGADRLERREAFAAAAGPPAPVLTFTDPGGGRAGGADVLDEIATALRSGDDAPTAAVTDDENTAVRLIAHLAQRGIRVPADISIAAAAGAGMTVPAGPPLTYCRMDFPAMGARGMELLELRTRTPRPAEANIVRVGFEFRVGQSTAPPPPQA